MTLEVAAVIRQLDVFGEGAHGALIELRQHRADDRTLHDAQGVFAIAVKSLDEGDLPQVGDCFQLDLLNKVAAPERKRPVLKLDDLGGKKAD